MYTCMHTSVALGLCIQQKMITTSNYHTWTNEVFSLNEYNGHKRQSLVPSFIAGPQSI